MAKRGSTKNRERKKKNPSIPLHPTQNKTKLTSKKQQQEENGTKENQSNRKVKLTKWE